MLIAKCKMSGYDLKPKRGTKRGKNKENILIYDQSYARGCSILRCRVNHPRFHVILPNKLDQPGLIKRSLSNTS